MMAVVSVDHHREGDNDGGVTRGVTWVPTNSQFPVLTQPSVNLANDGIKRAREINEERTWRQFGYRARLS
jgi:hypothetical protein